MDQWDTGWLFLAAGIGLVLLSRPLARLIAITKGPARKGRVIRQGEIAYIVMGALCVLIGASQLAGC